MRTERGTGLGIMIAAALAAGGCSQEVPDAHLPSVEPRLVVISHITPGQPVRVSVKKSEPVAYNILLDERGKVPTITNARVVIRCMATGAERAVPFLHDAPWGYESKNYQLEAADFPIRRGHTYRLDVSYGGLPPVTATVTVPEGIPRISGLQLVGLHDPDQPGVIRALQLVGAIHDPPGEEHHYRIGLVRAGTSYYTELGEDGLLDTIDFDFMVWQAYQAFCDYGRDGDTIRFRVEKNFSEDIHTLEQQVVIQVPDEHYARFKRALDIIRRPFDNPFSEPVLLPTNIQGGLGLFSAYLDTILVVRLTP